jgi:hypothetical protein
VTDTVAATLSRPRCLGWRRGGWRASDVTCEPSRCASSAVSRYRWLARCRWTPSTAIWNVSPPGTTLNTTLGALLPSPQEPDAALDADWGERVDSAAQVDSDHGGEGAATGVEGDRAVKV